MAEQKLHAEVESLLREFAVRVTALVARSIAEEVQTALSRHVGAAPRGGREAREERDEGSARQPDRAGPGGAPARRRRSAEPRPRAGAVERWVPDRRARRVPRFVIEATGLETKKEVVERYGEHAIFEKGQPAPPPLRAARAEAAE